MGLLRLGVCDGVGLVMGGIGVKWGVNHCGYASSCGRLVRDSDELK